jgi:taurine dioxygenase
MSTATHITNTANTTTLTIERLSGALGARVTGVDLNDLERQGDELRQAWADHQVLVFPRINLTPVQQLALCSIFGEPEAHGVDGGDSRETHYADDDQLITIIDSHRAGADVWHTDATFRERPPIGAMLQLTEKPEAGGDTMWLSTTRAYETLAPPLQKLCADLEAVHGHPPMTGQATHPVVGSHPVTGARTLFVNRGWTHRLRRLPGPQGRGLLELLYSHLEQPEHTMRWTWELGDAVLWDNRCTQHYAVYDYGDAPRGGNRVILRDRTN